MKQLLLQLHLCLLTLIGIAQTPVAYYPFTGNANDAVGTNNGMVNGATLATDRFGNANSAYSFDGVSSNISINNSATFSFTSYTISLWFKYNGAGTAGKSIWSLISKNSNGNGFDDQFHIWVASVDKTTGGRVGNGSNEFYVAAMPAVDNGTWHQSSLVFDNPNDLVKLYLDGVLISSVANTSNPFNNSSPIKIGFWEAFSNFFNGVIDEVKIYNTALTAAQVQSEYNASNIGLINYYPFSGNANDAVGTLNGTVNGATLTTDRFGSANSAYSFDGVNDFIGLNESFNGFTQLTVSAWYKVTGTSSDFQAIVSSDNSGKLVHMQMLTTAPTVNAVYNDGNGAILLNAPIAVLNQWKQVVITAKSGDTRIYENGILLSSSNVTFSNISSADLLRIGSGFMNGRFLIGSIDEVKIYNTALTAAQVQNDYLQSGYSTQFGNSVLMNGTADYIQPPALLNGTTQFTIEYWINTSESRSNGSFSQNPTMIGNEIPGASSGEFSIYSNNGFIGMWGELNSGTQNFLSTKKINDNRWHHIAASNDGTNVNLFADGIFVGNIPSGNGLSTSSFPLRIGANNPASIVFVPHQGLFDEVRFWNTARTQTQIVASMNTQLAGNEAGLVAYYDMNRNGQGAGLTVDNKATATGAALNGTTVGTANTPIFAPGVTQQKPGSGNAISFDGVDDEINSIQTPNSPNNFTMETWVKPNVTTPIHGQSTSGAGGQSGNNQFVVFPSHGNTLGSSNAHAGAGFSVGTNGICVFEHGDGYIPVLLSWAGAVSGWTHVAVVYTNKQPSLYVNGILVATGLTSLRTNVYPSNAKFGGGDYGRLNGSIDEYRIWSGSLTQTQIRDHMCRKITASDALYSNLVAYYNFDESTGNTAFDGTANANNGTLTNAPTRVTSGAAIGNASSHDYVNATKTTSLSHPTGESFTVTSSTGNPEGIQVYRVDEQPNTLSGTLGVGTNNKYFGVFQINGTAPTYQAAYNYTGNPGVTPANEVELRLNKRTDNSSTSWATMPETANEANNTITVLGQSTEYILGKVGIALPLNLLSFTGSKISTDAQLQWITANEINVAKYELQRADNGTNFATVGTVLAGGTNYTFTDAAIFATKQIVYYRIKMIDKNGSVTVSTIIKLSNYQNITLGIYPNPVKNVVTVSGLKQSGTLRLLSAEGKIIYQQIVTTQATTISMIGYAKGLYMLQYQYNGKVINEKLSKQ